jgi:MFS-type transporter involved in bile tolerance (Atg22 family)
VIDRARVLCVQRTGWAKSAVYFLATALLREAGAGPTLIISPLLALMRNQITAAQRLGLRALESISRCCCSISVCPAFGRCQARSRSWLGRMELPAWRHARSKRWLSSAGGRQTCPPL